MTPAQAYLKRFAVRVAGMYGISAGDLCTSSREEALEAKRVVLVVARDVLSLGPTQTGDALGISKPLVRHHLHQMGVVLRKNKALHSVVRRAKELARDEFSVYCEGLMQRGAAE